MSIQAAGFLLANAVWFYFTYLLIKALLIEGGWKVPEWRRRTAERVGGRVPVPPAPPGVMVQLSDGYYFPAGNDPYGPYFGDTDCVISTRTGECVRDHPHGADHGC
jgi:hypothetical protein